MSQKMRIAIATVLMSFALTTTASADDKPEQKAIGSRAMTLQEHVAHQEIRAKQAEKEVTAEQYKTKSYTTTHEGVYHRPSWVAPLGSEVQLEDGSVWAVAHAERKKTFNWYTNDTVIITPNHTWFSSYHYRLRNLTTGDNVKVNIDKPHLDTVLDTHWIAQIDTVNNEICLEDGSVWEAAGWDSSIVKKWIVGDRVVIGCNDGWFSGNNPNILINIETLNYAASRCVY